MSLRTAVAHRNLLYLLSLKELRTRYRKSILGWAWSLLNPISQMIIFSVLFLLVFGADSPKGAASGLDNFPLYFLSGLLPFQFFSISVLASMGSVQGGASLIKKVEGIFVTHTHDDHSNMVQAASEEFKCPIYATTEYEDVLENPGKFHMPGLTRNAMPKVEGMKSGHMMKWRTLRGRDSSDRPKESTACSSKW